MKPAISRVQRGARIVTRVSTDRLQKKCWSPQNAGLVMVTLLTVTSVLRVKVSTCGGRSFSVALPKKVDPAQRLCSPHSGELQLADGHANQPLPSIVPVSEGQYAPEARCQQRRQTTAQTSNSTDKQQYPGGGCFGVGLMRDCRRLTAVFTRASTQHHHRVLAPHNGP